jgi:hypothetical protein
VEDERSTKAEESEEEHGTEMVEMVASKNEVAIVVSDHEESVRWTADEKGKEARRRGHSMIEAEPTPEGARERRQRRGSAGKAPGKVIPTLARPRQFGYFTTQGEWLEKEDGT